MATYRSDMCDKRAALYRLYGYDGELLYVGITKNPRGRFAKHASRQWWRDVNGSELEWFPNRALALAAERSAIHHEQPIHNITRPRMECC